MKKAFEFILVLIIFYGVYAAFDKALPYVFPELAAFWIVIIALIVAALFLVLYSYIISSEARAQLNDKIHELEGTIKAKDDEVKNAFKIKQSVNAQAEESIEKDETL